MYQKKRSKTKITSSINLTNIWLTVSNKTIIMYDKRNGGSSFQKYFILCNLRKLWLLRLNLIAPSLNILMQFAECFYI